ncbi:hypothetical protein [Natronorubrum halophilum]|uniref:hypothetical protein n=1 Tax=Natronorubrum halophilum TaxID=1702106 RepID=UPI000EF6EDA4|nr:hypothetical protein [Natronorubrum halophilum]
MWPVDLYSVVGAAALEPIGALTVTDIGPETYRALGALERAGLQFGATLIVAMVVLGLVQGYGSRTVTKARRSPVISSCIGVPSLLVIAGVSSTGYLILGTSLGTFFGVVLVIIGLTVVPALTTIGFVAIGQSVAARFGRDQLWAGVLVGSLLSGLVGLSLVTTVLAVVLAGSLGTGAGVRVLMGAGGTTRPDDRTVPPANKI